MDFYIMNGLFVLAVLIPNVFLIFFKPKNIVQYEMTKKIKILETFERIGQLGIFISPLFFKFHYDLTLLILLIAFLVIYYIGWARFYISGCHFHDLFKPLFYIKVPLAVSPILYFMVLSLLLKSYVLFIFAIVFTIGHIPISLMNDKISSNKDN